MLKQGTSLGEASIEAGFADQSHMSRRFKNAYGADPWGLDFGYRMRPRDKKQASRTQSFTECTRRFTE